MQDAVSEWLWAIGSLIGAAEGVAAGEVHGDRPGRAEGDEAARAGKSGAGQVQPVVAAQPGEDQYGLLQRESGADAAALPAAERNPGLAVPTGCR